MSKTIVFLTGWAMDQKIWRPLFSSLSKDLSVKQVSWSNLHSSKDIDKRVVELITNLNSSDSVTLVGWSLGSITALKAASIYQDKIDQVILFSSTPRFLKDVASDLPFGWTKQSLEAMKDNLALNQEKTLASFYQKMFTKKEREMPFFESFIEEYTPTSLRQQDLQLGLDYLMETDIRDSLHNIKIPTHIIHGKQDKIISIHAGKWLLNKLSNSTFHQIESGHIPFFTKFHQCSEILLQALHKEV
jgi:pimeloyl-[acyl-carrier protein] methyl ester esterase